MHFFPGRQPTGNWSESVKPYAKKRRGDMVKFEVLSLFSFNLLEEIPDVKEDVSAEIRFVSDESLFAKESLTNKNHLFRDRLKRGDICCCAISSGEIVSYCWIASDKACVGEIGRKIVLKNGEIYLYDAFTKPEFRGNGLFSRILAVTLRYGREKGYQKAFVFALSSNKSSAAAIEKTGFNRFQNIYFLDIYRKVVCKFGKTRNGEPSMEDRFEDVKGTIR